MSKSEKNNKNNRSNSDDDVMIKQQIMMITIIGMIAKTMTKKTEKSLNNNCREISNTFLSASEI